MKKLLCLLFVLGLGYFAANEVSAQTESQKIEFCTAAAGDVTFQDGYPIQLNGAEDGERAPQFKKAIALRKGNRYRLTLCVDEESDSEEGVLQLFDEARLMGATNEEHTQFDFDCNKTGVYILIISFADGRAGSAVGILSHVKTL